METRIVAVGPGENDLSLVWQDDDGNLYTADECIAAGIEIHADYRGTFWSVMEADAALACCRVEMGLCGIADEYGGTATFSRDTEAENEL